MGMVDVGMDTEPASAGQPRPEDMREAMADYIRGVHQAYLAQARLQPPAVQGRMALLAAPFTVIAAGVQNLHVIATRETLAAPQGPEVELEEEMAPLRWSVRFYDPVVLPALGMIDEQSGPAGEAVRRALGVTTHLYHLIVQPGSQLTGHHAGHAGSGLANAHIAEVRDFETIRAHARGREAMVDEMEGAALAGLRRAQGLLAREIVPWDTEIAELATAGADPETLRRKLVETLKGEADG